MADLSEQLARLGHDVRTTSGELARPEQTLEAARRRLFHPPLRRPHGVQYWLLRTSAGGALMVVVALLLSLAREPLDSGVAFEVGARGAGRIGHVLEAEERDLTLRFSEGSRVDLAHRTQLTVTELGAQGAELVLGRGSLRAAIAPGRAVEAWAFRAGPFQVLVTGTVFEMSWDPAREQFELDMREGSVLISGPYVPDGREVVAGERLWVSVRNGSMNLERSGAEQRVATRVAAAPPDKSESSPSVEAAAKPDMGSLRDKSESSTSVEAAAKPDTGSLAGAATTSQAEPTARPPEPIQQRPQKFSELLSTGTHDRIIAAADGRDFDEVLSTLSLEQLYKLADVARFAGRPDLARQALLSARSRFGSPPRAAFLLGKVAADQHRDYAQAARWFETYLKEAPMGAFAEQALGRLIVLSRSTDLPRAKLLARRYLEQYPTGAYAGAARELVGSPRN